MKILLVHPYGSILPPLGLCLISAELKQAGYRDISLVDVAYWDDVKKEFGYNTRSREYLTKKFQERPDVVMFSASISTFNKAYEMAKEARKYCKYVLFGGPHPTLFQQRIMELVPIIDVVVYGEADTIIAELMRRLEHGEDLGDLPGTIYRKDGKIVKNPPAPTVTDLDEVPFPDREILDSRAYSGFFSLLTSRGCPFSCNFCTRPVTGKLFRGRSAKNIVDEIEFLLANHPKFAERTGHHFPIIDENFGVDKARVYAFCDELENRGLSIKWSLPNGLHVSSADFDMFKRMRETGCEAIYFGAESANDEMLRIMRKSSTREMIARAGRLCKQAGIRSGAHFIIGLQAETIETARETLRFIKEGHFDFANLNHAAPEPGTPLWEYVSQHGKFLHPFTEVLDYSKFHQEHTKPQFETPELTAEQREKLYEEGLKVIDSLLRKRVLSLGNIAKFLRATKDPRDYVWAIKRTHTLLFRSDLRRYYQPKPSQMVSAAKVSSGIVTQ